ncbi:MAG: four helix bundle protein [Patescibacteria group bacterium]|nr:four helix bundle protein [Patescibacteria group bacterium]
MKDFRKYEVWRRSHKLVIDIYRLTEFFPANEMYGIVSQIRRASVSIPTNFAEGCGRFSQQEFSRFLQISIGSSSEVEYLLILSKELEFYDKELLETLIIEVVIIRKKMIALRNKIRKEL